MSEYPKFYIFDLNRRVYKREDGRPTGGPIYSEHFIPLEIVDENEKEYVCTLGTINKRSTMFKYRYGNERKTTFTEDQREADIWMHSHRYKLVREVEACRDIEVLKKIAGLVGYKEEA